MAKSISVLIPTLGRQKELINTIEGLLQQTRVPDEIIVVDQNGSAYPEVDRFLAGLPIVRHIKAPTPGVALNYNRCLQASKSDVVLYVDDDVIPDSKLVEAHLSNYQANYQDANSENKKIGGVAGRVEEAGQLQDPEKISKTGAFQALTGSLTTAFNGLKRQDVQFSQGANMSFLREALVGIGGFDVGFAGNGYYFETDGCLRLGEAGYRIVFDPQAQLKHLMAASGGARVKDKGKHTGFFVRNGIRLVRRHSPLLILPIFCLKMFLYVIAKSLYNGNIRILQRGLMGLAQGIEQSMDIQS